MAKIRDIKDPKLKREIKLQIAAAKKSLREAQTAIRVAKAQIVVAEKAIKNANKTIKRLTSKKHPKKGDKQKTFFNKGQKEFFNKMRKVLVALNGNKKEFITFLKQSIAKESVANVAEIKTEASFQRFIKHLPKRKEVKRMSIISLYGNEVKLITRYAKMIELRKNYGKTVVFFPFTNIDLKDWEANS